MFNVDDNIAKKVHNSLVSLLQNEDKDIIDTNKTGGFINGAIWGTASFMAAVTNKSLDDDEDVETLRLAESLVHIATMALSMRYRIIAAEDGKPEDE